MNSNKAVQLFSEHHQQGRQFLLSHQEAVHQPSLGYCNSVNHNLLKEIHMFIRNENR